MTSTGQGFLTMLMRMSKRIHDNIITFLKGVNHGFGFFASPSVRGHLRPIDNDIGVVDELRPSVLRTVGGGLDKSGDIQYIHHVHLSGGDKQGAQ